MRPAVGPVVLQLLALGLIFVVLSIVYTSLLALVAGSIGPWFMGHVGTSRWQGKIVGGVFIALGIRLALQQQKH